MVKKILKLIPIGLLVFTILFALPVRAEEVPGTDAFETACQQIDAKKGKLKDYPNCATTPAECESKVITDPNDKNKAKKITVTPINCLFLEEPIGGDIGYDLYKVSAEGAYTVWNGEALAPGERVVQALLSYVQGKEYMGSLALLYSYVGIVYKFLSGIIIGVVVVVIILGGITIATAGAEEENFTKGKEMIIKALVGMVLWFLASLILYTINPTFFVF